MIINVYTVEEFYLRIEANTYRKTADSFLKRIKKRDWKTRAIATWDDTEIYNLMDIWMYDGNTSGKYLRSYSCQMEFEYIEDTVAFKLRWS